MGPLAGLVSYDDKVGRKRSDGVGYMLYEWSEIVRC